MGCTMPDIFQSNPHRTMIHGCRVWIAGVEVTQRLTSAISLSTSGRKGKNSASFSLSNASDGFLITDENVAGTWRIGGTADPGSSGGHSEAIKRALYDFKNSDILNPIHPDTKTRRWPLIAGQPVIHANDPVFIAERWPYTKESLWRPAFKGYIESKPFSTDHVMGKKSVDVSCVGLRGIMNKMRVQMNYLITSEAVVVDFTNGVVDDRAVAALNAFDPTVTEGLFTDLLIPSRYTHPLANLTLPQTIELLVVGGSTIANPTQRAADSAESITAGLLTVLEPETLDVAGIGRMKSGINVQWPQGDGTSWLDKQLLEKWHSYCLFGSVNDSEPWTEAQMIEHAENCTWNGSTAPHATSLSFLLPTDGTGMAGLVEYTDDSGSSTREWSTRLDILEDFLEKLDYQWYISGAGDIIVEFPMYDFEPSAFGGYESAFTFSKFGELKNTTFEDDKPVVPSSLRATGSFGDNLYAPAIISGDGLSLKSSRVTLHAPHIAGRFGAQVETVSFPYVLDICRLRQFAILAFQRKLALANTMNMEFIHRPILTPNRPLYNSGVERKGWVESISSTSSAIAEHGTPSTQATLKYIRKMDENGEWTLITGASSLPLTYNGSGPSTSPARGILVTEVFSPDQTDLSYLLSSQCDDSTTVGVGSVLVDPVSESTSTGAGSVVGAVTSNASEGCSTDADELASDIKRLWQTLQSRSLSELSLTLELTCTHRSGGTQHENIEPDLHILSPAQAFDIRITRSDNTDGTESDYSAVGAIGESIGLTWGGANPSVAPASEEQMRADIITRAKFHVSNETPALWGGDTTKGCDCSGFGTECYREAGVFEKSTGKYSAAAFFDKLQEPAGGVPRNGDIACYRSKTSKKSCSHVAIVEVDDSTGDIHVYSMSCSSSHTTLAISRAARASYLESGKGSQATVVYRTSGRGGDPNGYLYRSDFIAFRTPFSTSATARYSNHFSL